MQLTFGNAPLANPSNKPFNMNSGNNNNILEFARVLKTLPNGNRSESLQIGSTLLEVLR